MEIFIYYRSVWIFLNNIQQHIDFSFIFFLSGTFEYSFKKNPHVPIIFIKRNFYCRILFLNETFVCMITKHFYPNALKVKWFIHIRISFILIFFNAADNYCYKINPDLPLLFKKRNFYYLFLLIDKTLIIFCVIMKCLI